MGFQCLLRTSADTMGIVVPVQEDEDILKDEREIFLNGGKGLKKDLEAMVGKEIGQHRNEEIVRRKDRIEVQEPDAGRGIHDDQFVVLLNRCEESPQSKLS